MAVQFTTKEDSRTSEYRFKPEDLVIKPELNGRYELPNITWLIQSIKDRGQQTPVVIRSDGGKPTLVFGYSRWRAISEINKALSEGEKPLTIRCVYSRVNELDGFIDNIHENRVRNPNTPIDDAHNIAKLEKWGQTFEQIAAIYHEDTNWVKGRLALISLEPEAQAAVREGRLKVTAAKAISKLSAAQQRAVVAKAGAKGKVKLPEAAAISIKSLRQMAETAADDTTLEKATRNWITETLLPALGTPRKRGAKA